MNSTPLVSILTPCYNSRIFLPKTIDSVLAQTYQNFEMILVDDGPADPIGDIVEQYNSSKLKYFLTKNQGPANARNFAALHSSGEYIAWLNHDDLWTPWKLEEQLEALEKFNAVWIASGSQRLNFYTNQVIEDHRFHDYFKNVFYDILTKPDLWSASSIMIRKSVFMDVGMFNGDIWFMDDRDLYLRIAKDHPIVYLSNLHVYDRVSGKNIGSSLPMGKILDIHEVLLANAKKYDPNLPAEVVRDSKRMIYKSAVIQYLRANDIPNMRKMLRLLKFGRHSLKLTPYFLISMLSDQAILKIMAGVRKFRSRFFPSKYAAESRQEPA